MPLAIFKFRWKFSSCRVSKNTLLCDINMCNNGYLTFVDAIFKCTTMGANEVFTICAGWLIVSQSNTTSCRDLANSNIFSISACTSAKIENKIYFKKSWFSIRCPLVHNSHQHVNYVAMAQIILPPPRSSAHSFPLLKHNLLYIEIVYWGLLKVYT